MKMSLSQMIAIVCILAVGFMTVTPIVVEVEAHPKKVIRWAEYDVTMCSNISIITDITLVWGLSEVVEAHDDNPHTMKVLYLDTYNVEYVYCPVA